MKTVKLHDKTFGMTLPEEEILARVKAVAERINKDYEGREPMFLAVLNGSFMFASDLMKEIAIPCQISFVKLSSYAGTVTTGKVTEVIGITEDLSGRDIIIVEDIVESGHTMARAIETLGTRNPASVSICTMFFKPQKLQEDIEVKYAAMEIPDDFIVGYGLDYDQLGRNLRDIYTLIPEE